MGNIENAPITEKTYHTFQFEGQSGVVVGMQGWRATMEDTHIVCPNLEWLPNSGFFGVFDGHRGIQVASYCQEHLLPSMQEFFEKNGISNLDVDGLSSLLRDYFIHFDEEMRTNGVLSGGSTAICGLITETHFIISNLGDSRCILCRDGRAYPLSVDHKPILEVEQRRILHAGGTIQDRRVNGYLAVSRAFGDFDYKSNAELSSIEQLVSCEPDVRTIKRKRMDNYIVFGCDGIWDVYPNPQEFVDDFGKQLKRSSSLKKAVVRLLDVCLKKGSRDNMSLLVVFLDSPPELKQDVKRKEKDKKRGKKKKKSSSKTAK